MLINAAVSSDNYHWHLPCTYGHLLVKKIPLIQYSRAGCSFLFAANSAGIIIRRAGHEHIHSSQFPVCNTLIADKICTWMSEEHSASRRERRACDPPLRRAVSDALILPGIQRWIPASHELLRKSVLKQCTQWHEPQNGRPQLLQLQQLPQHLKKGTHEISRNCKLKIQPKTFPSCTAWQ